MEKIDPRRDPEAHKMWTGEDHEQAAKQGWVISETDRVESDEPRPGYGFRPFELQKLDESGAFKSDGKAWSHVKACAARGEPLAVKALAFLARFSPPEHKAITEHTALDE